MWLRSVAAAARLRGDARPQHHRRQRQDLRRRAGRERRARRARDRVVPRGHRRPRPRPAGRAAEGDREHPGDRPLHRGARRRAASPTPVEGDVYFRVASDPEYGRLSGQRPDQVEEQEPNPLKEDPRDFALWKANKPGEDTCVGLAVGPRPARLAHRVLGDGRGGVRAGVRDPRRRARPRLPAPRERARAVARARPRVRAHLDAQRDARVRRREDVEVARQRRLAPQRARHVGARGRAALLHDRPLAQADRLHRRDAGAGEGAGRDVPERVPLGRASRGGDWAGSFEAALDDDFNTPRRARGPARLASSGSDAASPRRSTLFGLGSLARAWTCRRPRSSRSPNRGRRRARQGLRRGRPAARRDRRRSAGRSATSPGGYELVRSP